MMERIFFFSYEKCWVGVVYDSTWKRVIGWLWFVSNRSCGGFNSCRWRLHVASEKDDFRGYLFEKIRAVKLGVCDERMGLEVGEYVEYGNGLEVGFFSENEKK